eukprot:CAMPEP_0168203464 /NCGR_PEP_ID=MMETSP0139_2-20121125/24867_1 /TAXON_ID=44445 /ORGANISM="Pseudo-nitzschia australis, Strain 10249 10 AB" /LENGTH=133 /DNA_ID=CAMNT_0008129315 /DNA_START=244 /DNA_END=646 /DNA_ORIENTATION=+
MLTPPYSYGYAIDPVHDLSAFREDANTKTTSSEENFASIALYTTRSETQYYSEEYNTKNEDHIPYRRDAKRVLYEQDRDHRTYTNIHPGTSTYSRPIPYEITKTIRYEYRREASKSTSTKPEVLVLVLQARSK